MNRIGISLCLIGIILALFPLMLGNICLQIITESGYILGLRFLESDLEQVLPLFWLSQSGNDRVSSLVRIHC